MGEGRALCPAVTAPDGGCYHHRRRRRRQRRPCSGREGVRHRAYGATKVQLSGGRRQPPLSIAS
jgi:hypothetical protein